MKLDELLKDKKEIGITGHIRPDGDCLGSTLGLYNYIRENYPQIQADLYLQQPGEEFSYLPRIADIRTEAQPEKIYDLFFVLDCSSMDRIEPFADCFANAKETVCLDHHISNDGTFAQQNQIEPEASSTCEVLFSLLEEDRISRETATCLYTGIIHDTGVFKYSCTSLRTMTIAGKMMEKGIDFSSIIDNSFYKKTYIQNQVLGRALLESVLFYDGRCIFSSITRDIMDLYEVEGSQLGGIIEQLRLTEGVEVAIFLYETEPHVFKVSLRSKKRIDVSRIAVQFGGGGHVRAAGFTDKGTVYQIINRIGAQIEAQYNELEGKA